MSNENLTEKLKKLESNVNRLKHAEYVTDVYLGIGGGIIASSLFTTYFTSYRVGNTTFIDIDSSFPRGFLMAAGGLLLRLYTYWIKEGPKETIEKLKSEGQ